MNNYYTLYHLVGDFKQRLEGFHFVEAWSGVKKTIHLLFEKEGVQKTLLFQATSDAVMFISEGGSSRKNNSVSFFESLAGKKALGWELAEEDRIVTVQFETNQELRFYLFGPRANVIFLEKGVVKASFRQCALPLVQPSMVLVHKIAELEQQVADGSLKTVQQAVLAIDPRFPRKLIPALTLQHGLDLQDLNRLYALVQDAKVCLLLHPVFRRRVDGGVCLLDETFLPVQDHEAYSDVNTLVRQCWLATEIRSKYRAHYDAWITRLRTQIDRIRAVILELSDDQKAIHRADLYEKFGHILMANSHLKQGDVNPFTTVDIFEPDKMIQIEIKKDLSISENAQLYYEKARQTRHSITINQHRKTDYQKKLSILTSLMASLVAVDGPRSLDRWIKSNTEELNKALPQAGSSSSEGSNKPWRVLHIGGFEVWVGKSASSNDSLTQAAHKEDIWMHARGVVGSHVVIRMNKRVDFPPKPVMETAAGWAAWYSKAKTSSMVPVSATKRKYVRKPKGAAPGMVLIEKETVLLVKPEKPGLLQ
jgi:predicted ribosome quality control (RQC) complex YloA/Tae2 family protein